MTWLSKFKDWIDIQPFLDELVQDEEFPEQLQVRGMSDLLFHEQEAFSQVVNTFLADAEKHLDSLYNKDVDPSLKIYPIQTLISQYKPVIYNMVNNFIINGDYEITPSERREIVDRIIAVCVRSLKGKIDNDDRWKVIVPDGYVV